MLVTPLGMVMLSSLLHPENADAPMFVTLFGIVTLVKLLQFWKAPLFNPVRTLYKYNIIF